MDAFFPRDNETPQPFTVDALIDTLINRLGVHTFFSFTYRAAITTAIISGEANIIGQYIEEEFTIKLNLLHGTATLLQAGEVLETYPIDKDDFDAHLNTIRQSVAAWEAKIYTPETLAPALIDSLWDKTDVVDDLEARERLVPSYLASITVATIHGDCRVISPDSERLDLVIHPTRPTATICQGDEIVDAFKLDLPAFQALRDFHDTLVGRETNEAEEDAE